MLSKDERKNLTQLDRMDAKPRGNMMFRLRGKLKTALNDMNEIIFTLDHMPPKSAQKVVTDEHVAAAFALSEKLVEILGYAPIEEFDNLRYVTRTKEIRTIQPYLGEPATKERLVKTEPATAIDEARNQLVKTHVMKLSERIDARAARIPSDFMPWSGVGGRTDAITDGLNQAEEWIAKARQPKTEE